LLIVLDYNMNVVATSAKQLTGRRSVQRLVPVAKSFGNSPVNEFKKATMSQRPCQQEPDRFVCAP